MSLFAPDSLPAATSCSPSQFRDIVLTWFDGHGRKDLPWQHPITPYRVWVSEIMLQQTQVTTVIPYFERFMQRFPDVETLATAPEDDVLSHWAGLGYYARARNLHKCAQTVWHDHAGEFPAELDALAALPGIGRSTAGAILSIAFERPAAILDGNVKRVLCRLHAVAGWPGRSQVAQQLWELAETYTPTGDEPKPRCRDYTQAMMDLGATLCTRSRPRCADCPLRAHCQGFHQGNPTAYPASKPKQAKPERATWMLILRKGDAIFLQKRPAQGIWGGLWSFPEFPDADALESAIGDVSGKGQQALTPFRHTFTHYHLQIHPVLVTLKHATTALAEAEGQWYNSAQLDEMGLPAPVQRLVDQLNAVEEMT